MSLVGIGFILVGLFFVFVAAIGVVRLPDVYTRSHAVGLKFARNLRAASSR